MTKVRQRKREIVDSFYHGGEWRPKRTGVDLIPGEALFVAPNELEVRLSEGGEIATMLQIAMMGEVPYTALRAAIFAHPASPSRSTTCCSPSSSPKAEGLIG